MQQKSPSSTRQPRLAVLIDAENLSGAHAPQLMSLVARLGKPIIRRAYGDWTTSQLTLWKSMVHTLAIRPYQQFHYRRSKNASDAALIMDAMELLHQRRVDGFCLVSSDSDFTGLAARIQEAGVPVYGFGRRDTAQAFMAACDAFTYLDSVESAA
jgi:uncharacterized LabA/DUF88 family protein